ncbi:unnamed protein product [Mytilus coruscus]|uniref:Uncharacterized protein n=1 Tax=Mytilus coruscus TaxID=42192 RepID=A0A6J8B622_MYTCO|nr:unnamed protein product [Mytilus coruscus]
MLCSVGLGDICHDVYYNPWTPDSNVRYIYLISMYSCFMTGMEWVLHSTVLGDRTVRLRHQITISVGCNKYPSTDVNSNINHGLYIYSGFVATIATSSAAQTYRNWSNKDGTELRSRTLSSIKPEVSQALDSLLEELRNSEDAEVMRAATSNFPAKSKFVHEEKLKLSYQRSIKSCPLCKAAGRPDRHFLSKCSFLPNSDRKYMVKARQIAGIFDNSDDESSDVEVDTVSKPMHSVNRVQVRQSPYLDVFHTHYNTRLTIDSGATGNMLRASAA